MKEPKPPRRWNSTLPVTPKKPRVAKKSAPTSRAWINRTTPKQRKGRKPSETERAHGPEEFREWTKRQKCIVRSCTAQPCDAAHVHSGGTGRKDDWTRVVPLCSTQPYFGYEGHHEQYDKAKKSFAKQHGLEMDTEAVAHQAAWQAELSRRSA